MITIEVSNISKYYGKIQVLKDVGFSVNKGGIFGLIGPNGADKTSMFHIFCSPPLSKTRTAIVDGFDAVSQMKEIRKWVDYVPGSFSPYQDLTIGENINFSVTLFNAVIEGNYDTIKPIYSQIEQLKNRKVGVLSDDMEQKLALCRALAHQPNVPFPDEPTTGVGPISRKEFWEILSQLKECEITIAASTLYLDEVRSCERVVLPPEGIVQGTGTADDILTAFEDIFNPPTIERTTNGKAVNDANKETRKIIEVEYLIEAFGLFHAVDDISFMVRKGEIFGFLGASGAGKTTAMHVLTGLNQPTNDTGGTIGFDTRTEYEQIKRHIGYMSQKFSLCDDLIAVKNISPFADIYGIRGDEICHKTDALLEHLNLSEHRNTSITSLPLGWKQKLTFSVSIFHNPGVMFLNEPTGSVDPATRHQFWKLIYGIAGRGITVFVTTRYTDEAGYCDYISIVVNDKIKALGTPDELKRTLNQPDMDHVFTYLVRQAKRSSD